jgi:hypothetical protein
LIRLQPLPWLDEQLLQVEPLQPLNSPLSLDWPTVGSVKSMSSHSARRQIEEMCLLEAMSVDSASPDTTSIANDSNNNSKDRAVEPLLVLRGLQQLEQYPPFQQPVSFSGEKIFVKTNKFSTHHQNSPSTY